MGVGLAESFAGAHRNRAQKHDGRDTLADPGAVLGLDFARDDVQDVRAHRVDHRTNLVAVVGQRQRDTTRARTNRSQNFARQVWTDRLGDDCGLSHDQANQIGARRGSRDRVGHRRHAVNLYGHLRRYPRPPRSSLPGVASVHRPSSQVISPLTMIAR